MKKVPMKVGNDTPGEEADFINRGIHDYNEGKVQNGNAALRSIRKKYGI